MSSDLDEVVAARNDARPIGREHVLRWMRSQDLEALGALYHSITDRRFEPRITPGFSMEEYQGFARHYFGRCLREDPVGQWCDSRYSAGHSLMIWLVDLTNHGDAGWRALREWKHWLGDLYRSSDEALRTALVTATLEHLFERPQLAKYFEDWRDDSTLRIAHDEAMEWVKRGGRTGLGRDELPGAE